MWPRGTEHGEQETVAHSLESLEITHVKGLDVMSGKIWMRHDETHDG